MNRRSGGGGGGYGNNRVGNRFNDNYNSGGGRLSQNNNRGQNNFGPGGGGGQQQGWRQQGQGNNNQGGGHQGGGGMNQFDNRSFQQQQQQQHQQQQNMMNHQNHQFANQLSNAVMRNSVGPNPGMMSSFGGPGNQDQPVVMVVPQSQAQAMGGGNMGNMGNMGMGMPNQNPFAAAVMHQQKPMQVIVGNMPGLNPAAFGQQVLPAYGQGVGEQQNMGMYNQQQQQGQQGPSNRFGGQNNKNSNDRGGRMNQRNQKVTLVRRTDMNDRGRVGGQTRGVAKKRIIVTREQFVDAKKAKVAGVVVRNRLGGVVRKDRLKNRRPNKAGAGNKGAAAKAEDKKETKEKTAVNGDASTGEGDAKAETTESGEKKPCKYEDIPVEFLACKVCRKTFSTGPDFESHLAEKVHVTLMKILEEKFAKRAQLLMFESKMCEDETAVQMDRPRRSGKNQGKASKTHCKMCDCSYTVNWGTHKQSVWHRVLKEFLHPNCRFCKSQFVHRKDWVEHTMSVGHIKKLIELRQEGKISVIDQESILQEELFAVHIELSKEEKMLNIVNVHSLGGQQPLTDDIKAMLQGEQGEIQLPEGEIKIPEKYDENVAFGEDAFLKVGGGCCKVCRLYLPDGEESGHFKSRQHFDSYVEYLKRVVKLREQKAAEERKAQEEAEKKAKAEAEAAVKAAEEAKKAAEAAATAATEKKESTASGSSATESKPEQMDVDQKQVEQAAAEAEAADANAEENEEDETMEEEAENTAQDKAVVTAASKSPETAKTVSTPNKTPQRGGQQNRGARGSPARGRGQPGRGGGGYNRGGRGGQQPQTPARGGATPRVNNNARGGRGGQARGGARGSPGRGRGRGGW